MATKMTNKAASSSWASNAVRKQSLWCSHHDHDNTKGDQSDEADDEGDDEQTDGDDEQGSLLFMGLR